MNSNIWICIYYFVWEKPYEFVYMNPYNRSRLFICSCFFSRLYICSCFFESTYCTYLFYVHTVRALLIIPASLFALVFYIYLLYILIPRTYCKCSVDRSRLFICSCFLYVPTVSYFVETCSHFENYFLPQPKNWRSRRFICSCFFCIYTYFFYLHTVHSLLTVLPLYFAHVFLYLPTVHT